VSQSIGKEPVGQYINKKEVKIELNCELFEEGLSDYLEQEMNLGQQKAMEAHVVACCACAQLLHGISQVRTTVQTLGHVSPAPDFRLRLAGEIHNRIERRGRAKARIVALGLAAGAALAIVLWPEPSALPLENRNIEWNDTRQAWRQMWAERLPMPAAEGPHSHTRLRLASF
jgi:hypothetical protein